MNLNLSIISFMECFLGILSKNMSPYPRSSRFSPILSSRSFMVLHFTCKYVINFELIFVKRYKAHVQSHCSACGCSVVSASFIEKTVFVPLYCLCFFVRNNLTIFIELYFGAVLFHSSLCPSLHQCNIVLPIRALQKVLMLDSTSPPFLFFSVNIMLALQGQLSLHINFKLSVLTAIKQLTGILIENIKIIELFYIFLVMLNF